MIVLLITSALAPVVAIVAWIDSVKMTKLRVTTTTQTRKETAKVKIKLL
jgi:hypothetical protein